MGINITNFFWENLPEGIKERDTYKDDDNRGVLERYLSIFGIELQQEAVPKLENLINELDPETASDIFLSEIAYMVARPKDILEDIGIYRTVLIQIISLYKIKGTTKSYQLFFNLLGMNATLEEHFPPPNVYDGDLIYDDDSGDAQKYDQTECEVGCIEYTINYSNQPGKTIAPLTGQLRINVIDILEEFLQPIDCKMRDLIYTV